MVRIQSNMLIIEIVHESPHEFLLDIYTAIIYLMQNSSENTDKRHIQQANEVLSEFLKSIE